jgi:hypothetical protein
MTSQLSREHQPAFAGHRRRFDKQDIAAHAGHGSQWPRRTAVRAAAS